jgi:hypothetical protein
MVPPRHTEFDGAAELEPCHDRRSAMMRTLPAGRSRFATLALAVVGLVLGACVQSTTPSPPSPSVASPSLSVTSPSPSAAPTQTTIASPDAAAALVLGSDPRFAGLKLEDPNLIGQCCFYTATQAADGYAVTIEIGWGDCPAGCTDRHHWFYTVATDGTIHLDREDGPAVPSGVPGPGDGTTGGVIGIRGMATAGPVCPVVTPDDPACADRPVVGALVHVIDATGTEVATLETDAAGAFVVSLPPGRYRLVPDPVTSLMGTAAPVVVTVGTSLVQVQLTYDTGIR